MPTARADAPRADDDLQYVLCRRPAPRLAGPLAVAVVALVSTLRHALAAVRIRPAHALRE